MVKIKASPKVGQKEREIEIQNSGCLLAFKIGGRFKFKMMAANIAGTRVEAKTTSEFERSDICPLNFMNI